MTNMLEQEAGNKIILANLSNIMKFKSFSQSRITDSNKEVEDLTARFNLHLEDINTKLNDDFRFNKSEFIINKFNPNPNHNHNHNQSAYSYNNNHKDGVFTNYEKIKMKSEEEIKAQLEKMLKDNNYMRGDKRRKNFSLENEDYISYKKSKIKNNKTVDNITPSSNLRDKENVEREENFYSPDVNIFNNSNIYENAYGSNNLQYNSILNTNESKSNFLQKLFNEDKDIIEEMPSIEEENLKVSMTDKSSTLKESKLILESIFSDIKNNGENSDGKTNLEKDLKSLSGLKIFKEDEKMGVINNTNTNINNESKKQSLYDLDKLKKNLESKSKGQIGINNNNNNNNPLTEKINHNNEENILNNQNNKINQNSISHKKIENISSKQKENSLDLNLSSFSKPFTVHHINRNSNINNINNNVNNITTFNNQSNGSILKNNLTNENINSKSNKNIPPQSNVLKNKELCLKILYDDNGSNLDESPVIEKWSPDNFLGINNNQIAVNNFNTKPVENLDIGKVHNIFNVKNENNNVVKGNLKDEKLISVKKSHGNIYDDRQKVEAFKNQQIMSLIKTKEKLNNNINNINNNGKSNLGEFTFQKNKMFNKKNIDNGYEITDKSGSSDEEDPDDPDFLDKTPYFNNKKMKRIPNWANDKNYLTTAMNKQKEINYKAIFGRCKIDNLSLNLIFSDQKYNEERGDSVDWRLDNTNSSIILESTHKKKSDVNSNNNLGENNARRNLDFNSYK